MRLIEGLALLALGAMLTAAGVPAPAGDRTRSPYEGDWETVIASPRRPWIFLVHLRPAGAAWTGTMSVEGLGESPGRS